jgi:hypothetical protein
MPIMSNSRMPDDWVQRAVASAPFTKLPDGNYRTCPLRMAFVHLLLPNPDKKNDDGTPAAKPQYEVTGLLPPGGQEQVNAVVWPEAYTMMKTKWPTRFSPSGQPIGLNVPWRDQGSRISRKNGQLWSGMTAGLGSMKFTTEYKPQIVDTMNNPIVDERRVYAGAWAVLLFNLFTYDNKQSGVGLGLQGVMLVADDDNLQGGGPDLKTAFAGVNVEARFDAAAAFGAPPGAPPLPGAPPPPPGAAFLPPPTPIAGTHAPVPQAFDLNAMLG